jgi:hypothetical protein
MRDGENAHSRSSGGRELASVEGRGATTREGLTPLRQLLPPLLLLLLLLLVLYSNTVASELFVIAPARAQIRPHRPRSCNVKITLKLSCFIC